MRKRCITGLLACTLAAWACAEDDSFVEDASVDKGCAVFVDGEAAPGGDGLSPETAYATIDEAMEGARTMLDRCEGECEIRLAEGMLDDNAFQLLSRSVAGSGLTVRKWEGQREPTTAVAALGGLNAVAAESATRQRNNAKRAAAEISRTPVWPDGPEEFENHQTPQLRDGTTIEEWVSVAGTSSYEDPYLMLNNYDSDYVDWVLRNVNGNLYVRRAAVTGSGYTGERIAFRTDAAPKSAVDLIGYENGGSGDGSAALRLINLNTGNSTYYALVMDGNEVDSWSGSTQSTQTSTASIYLNHNSMGNVIMCDQGGGVAIGTSSTSGYMLSVNGDIRAQEVVVTTEGWSDDVFEEGYRLQSLPEVEAYIETNGHLPGVPSAGEVLEKGVPVGEVQSILLRKVEELTLHAIEQGKRIDALAADNERLRHELAGPGKGNGR